MKLKTTFRFYNDDSGSFFGAYKVGSLTNGEPQIFINMDAFLETIQEDENKKEVLKGSLLSTLTHEFCHSMQEWLDKEFDELEVEKILGDINPKWNVFNATEEEGEDKTVFRVNDLLQYMDNICSEEDKSEDYKTGAEDYKQAIRKIFSPIIAWNDAFAKDKKEKDEKNKSI